MFVHITQFGKVKIDQQPAGAPAAQRRESFIADSFAFDALASKPDLMLHRAIKSARQAARPWIEELKPAVGGNAICHGEPAQQVG